MVNSFAMMHAGSPGTQFLPIHRGRHRSWNNANVIAAIFGMFRACRNPLKRQASLSVEPSLGLRRRAGFGFSHLQSGDISQMTLTVAHISPIMSLIAGVLILIMPRLLNLIVALFLILNGLIGLGALKWLHM
jgi:hypothetical protein